MLSTTLRHPTTVCCVYGLSDVDTSVADGGADIAEFNERSSNKNISVVRGHTAVITCPVPTSIPSPPEISYLRDGRLFTLTGE